MCCNPHQTLQFSVQYCAVLYEEDFCRHLRFSRGECYTSCVDRLSCLSCIFYALLAPCFLASFVNLFHSDARPPFSICFLCKEAIATRRRRSNVNLRLGSICPAAADVCLEHSQHDRVDLPPGERPGVGLTALRRQRGALF
ncbi:hypothetical protein BCV70DRAFT_45413 [Testicularia cyperi]|uniref:Uncharacterized protein n=1 Tax=Testicularia cyperi TaxID=1882483 RepID=A0A317XHS7_9BASI|nr:hypothetical protein BCV70DRAFT_45413 [Testicularia cyperi]